MLRGSAPGSFIQVVRPPAALTTPTRTAELVAPALGYCTGTTWLYRLSVVLRSRKSRTPEASSCQ